MDRTWLIRTVFIFMFQYTHTFTAFTVHSLCSDALFSSSRQYKHINTEYTFIKRLEREPSTKRARLNERQRNGMSYRLVVQALYVGR